MKTFLSLAVVLSLLIFVVETGFSQAIPPNPLVPKKSGGTGKRSLGGGGDIGGGVSVAKPSTVVVQHIAVTPLQNWKNLSGKKIQARLLAFSAPKPGEKGPIEVIRDGKVRFLLPGKPQPVDYPLDQLGELERNEIRRIAKAAEKGAPEEEAESKETEAKPSPESKP